MNSYEVIKSYNLVKILDFIKNCDLVKGYKLEEKYKVLKLYELRLACDFIINQKVLIKNRVGKTYIIERIWKWIFDLYLIQKN